MTNLQKRIVSAVVLAALLFGMLFFVPYGEVIVFAVITAACCYELAAMVQPTLPRLLTPAIGLGVFIGMGLLLRWSEFAFHEMIHLAIVLSILGLIALLFRQRSPRPSLHAIVGAYYIGAGAASIFFFSALEDFISWLVTTFLMVWASDVGGYFVGRAYGRRPLAPHISPKKTMAGFWGGLTGALMIAGLGGYFMKCHLDILMMGVIVHLAAVIGDLAVSKVKRLSHTKDSSSLIPGHGGFLDRCDGLLLALPIAAFVVAYLMS